MGLNTVTVSAETDDGEMVEAAVIRSEDGAIDLYAP